MYMEQSTADTPNQLAELTPEPQRERFAQVGQAAERIASLFKRASKIEGIEFSGLNQYADNILAMLPGVEAEMADSPSIAIDDLDLSVRLHNTLKRNGINTTDDLQALSPADLYSIRVDSSQVIALAGILKTYGLKLREEDS